MRIKCRNIRKGRGGTTILKSALLADRCVARIFLHFSESRPIKYAAIPQRTRLIRSQKRKSPGGPEIGRLITVEFQVSVQSELSVR